MTNIPLSELDVHNMSAAHLIKELDNRFPHKCPELSDDDRVIWFNSGRRELIDLLLKLL